jgi:cytochrome c oxidase assembly protein subunit 15
MTAGPRLADRRDRFTLTLAGFHRLALVTTLGICVLVVAGGAVRLTGSGLGCDDWPNCNEASFIDVSSGHTAIEQLNRLLSGLIGIPTLLLAIGAFRVRPRRRGLVAPALVVLLTVLANGVVGGIAVRTDLHPALVQSHFLLAMISIGAGVVAIDRSRAAAAPRPSIAPTIRRLTVAVTALTAAALVTGTVVTGTGPHAGDEDVRRFGFDISDVARLHSVTVLATLGTALALVVVLRRSPGHPRAIDQRLSAWLFLGVLQGFIGYVQYFTGVPEVLVGAHLAGATALWAVTVLLWCSTARRPSEPVFRPARAGDVPSPATWETNRGAERVEWAPGRR